MPTSFGQPLAQHGVSRELHEHRGRELAGLRDQRVVGAQLGLDAFVGDDLLDASHLLDLPAHRVAVLEHERAQLANRHAPARFQSKDALLERAALALVGAQVGDVGERELARGGGGHCTVSSGMP
jgi:hypothetical protein